MIGLVEIEFKRNLSVSELDKLKEMFYTYGFKIMKISLIESVLYKKLSLSYMEACLESWKRKGYTLDQLASGIHRSV